MFTSSQSIRGLQAIGFIAGSSRQQPVPTTRLVWHIGLCLSSTEIIVKQLKNGGLIRPHHGPAHPWLRPGCLIWRSSRTQRTLELVV